MTPIYIVGNTMHARYLVEYFTGKTQVMQLNRENSPIDTCDSGLIKKHLASLVGFIPINLEGSFIINCERVTSRDHATRQTMIRYNSLLPHVLADVASYYHMKLIHLSTNCVFSGKRGKYVETDSPDASSDYGKSMSLGEPDEGMVLRASVIGEGDPTNLVEWVKGQSGQVVNGWNTVEWNGITALELCREISVAMRTWTDGVYHVHGQTMTKAELISQIALAWDVPIKMVPVHTSIEKATLSSIFRSYHHPLISDRLDELRQFNISMNAKSTL